ncbi:MAG: hypothetical protein ABI833_22785 [Acidobacteriota bacterium]
MNKFPICLVLATFGFSTPSLSAQVQAGAVISGDGLRSFYFAIGNYYQVPEREVVVVRERSLPPDEVPVVFYVARQAHVQPAVIVDLRKRGASWADIALHFRLAPDVYYFRGGPPYGKAYGYWKKHPPRDEEVIEAVNIHFLSDYHRVSPDAVRMARSRGPSYAVVARGFDPGSGKGEGHGKDDRNDDREHGRSRDHGHGKGHER